MSFTSMHNDHLDPDKHLNEPEPPEAYQTVLDFFSAENEDQCKRNLYKYTDCGAWIDFTETGIRLGSIVEGCDSGTAVYPLNYADKFTAADIQARINAIEAEASATWDWANNTDENEQTAAEQGLEAPDTSWDYRHLNPE